MVGIERPYRRTVRPHLHSGYPWSPEYVRHPKFALEPEMYIRGFRLLQKDLEHLFEYIEPSDDNLKCYSLRVHELLFRACVEVEANCKAILRDNGYPQEKRWTMADYYKVDQSHYLSLFEVKLPHWHGERGIRKPFGPWKSAKKLESYVAYNTAKHDRGGGFKAATLEHAVDDVCGVLVVLSAQFGAEDFSVTDTVVGNDPADGFRHAIGGYFVIRYPIMPIVEHYEFNWYALQREEDPFQNYPYS